MPRRRGRSETAEYARRVLSRFRVRGGSGPVATTRGNGDGGAVHEREIVIAVRIAGQRDRELGVALGVIPLTEPELGLGQEC